MTRSRLIAGLILALALLVYLLASAPARLLLSVVPGEGLILQGVRGTLWNGQASRVLLATGNGWLHLGATQWQLRPLSLLLLSPELAIESQWGRQTVEGDLKLYSEEEFALRGVQVSVDAALLRQYLPVGLEGDFSLQFEKLLVRNEALEEAVGRVVWQNGGWVSPQGPRQLGSYAVDLSTPEPGVIQGQVISLAGDLEAQGEVGLQGPQYSIDVVLSGQGLEDAQLRQALQLAAAPEGGDFRVTPEGGL